MKQWVENALWSWRNCIDYRVVYYDDRIAYRAFFEELNYGWYKMESDYTMSQPGFDPYNLLGRDPYYREVMKRK